MKWAGTRLKEAVTILNRYEIHRRRQFSYRKRADYTKESKSVYAKTSSAKANEDVEQK